MEYKKNLDYFLSRTPKTINKDVWYYHTRKGLSVIAHQQQIIISWSRIKKALKDFNEANAKLNLLK